MKNTSAILFDGSSASGTPGTLELHHQGLTFHPTEGERRELDFSEVHDLERLGGKESSIEFKNPDAPPPFVMVRFKDADMHDAVEQSLMQVGALGVRSRIRGRKTPLAVLLVLFLIVMPLGYIVYTQGATAMHGLVSFEKEAALGEWVHELLMDDYVICDDPSLAEQCQELVSRLADPESPYEYRVTVVQESDPNAFALPGGRILIHSGLLQYTDDPDTLAGVLAHEMAHVEQRHGLKQLFRSMGVILFMQFAVGGGLEELEALEAAVEFGSFFAVMKYSRDAEREADAIAIDKLRRNQISSDGILAFFKRLHSEMEWMDKLGWVSSHPVNTERIGYFQHAVEKEEAEHPPCIHAELYQEMQKACPADNHDTDQ